ncbi:PTS sugar transporter subunit IIB [Vibrio vulnificus]|uniref:PTS sugar transporter subunit IIB n=1 Tax=Vibrio vulnificus TaxID=672 RepID=UPI0021DAE70F|nr:PTS sugar transporter subunit IIB [Vibrio vulnificus]MCU8152178.1 PTS sugar transporter subunit IIB [Vibrio vulnificus]MDK2617967.1 PTS sugar transporter subunit IIB [Vibrio vulnificus]MDK2674796.1 PTS sugar transporter subunit IIB [Vibrio vulnificus]
MKRILLICAAGMSTSMLMKKMSEYASQAGEEAKIEAHGVDVLKDIINEFDAVLVAPQIRFKLAEVQGIAEAAGKKAAAIEPMAYGSMNGEKVFKQALSLI